MNGLASGVSAEAEAEVEEVWGDCVLVTVPLGCLQNDDLGFDPPLPQWKLDAIHRLGFGPVKNAFYVSNIRFNFLHACLFSLRFGVGAVRYLRHVFEHVVNA